MNPGNEPTPPAPKAVTPAPTVSTPAPVAKARPAKPPAATEPYPPPARRLRFFLPLGGPHDDPELAAVHRVYRQRIGAARFAVLAEIDRLLAAKPDYDLTTQRDLLLRLEVPPWDARLQPLTDRFRAERRRAAEDAVAALDGKADPGVVGMYKGVLRADADAHMVGRWQRPLTGENAFDQITVSADPATGEWAVVGEVYTGNALVSAFHGEEVAKSDRGLTFRIKPDKGLDTLPLGSRGSIRFSKDALSFVVGAVTATLTRLDGNPETGPYYNWPRYGGFPDIADLSRPVDLRKSHEVLRALSELASFPHQGFVNGTVTPLPERCYIPHRPEEAYPGTAKCEAAAEAALARLGRLSAAGDEDLGGIARDIGRVVRTRAAASALNAEYGSTMVAFITGGRARLLDFGLRAAPAGGGPDREQLGRTLDAFRDAFDRIEDDAKRRAFFSRVIQYGDMRQVDAAAEVWRRRIMPHVYADRRPETNHRFPLGADWLGTSNDNDFVSLGWVRVSNDLDRDLHNVVIDMTLETGQGDRCPHYFFLPILKQGESRRLGVQLRWGRWVLPFESEVRVKLDLYSDDGTYPGTVAVLRNPNPDPAGKAGREAAARDMARYEAAGVALVAAAGELKGSK